MWLVLWSSGTTLDDYNSILTEWLTTFNNYAKYIWNKPWSRSEAVTVNTDVPGPLFSITVASNSARWNTGASSFTSITRTESTWEVESWGIPWSSATMVRLKTSCSSRSKAFRMEREPGRAESKGNFFLCHAKFTFPMLSNNVSPAYWWPWEKAKDRVLNSLCDVTKNTNTSVRWCSYCQQGPTKQEAKTKSVSAGGFKQRDQYEFFFVFFRDP